jgi:Cd2+/Zn2+-exporting ATPase/Cu+-exporting ATPase
MSMELSMTIALTAALLVGEVFTALVIIFFVLIAEVLEEKTVERGRHALRALTDQLPELAEVISEAGAQEKSLHEVAVGDVVLIRPGSLIPVDGEVVKGNSFVDQAAITGESLPVAKVGGTSVYAGTVNQSGVLEVRVAKVGLDTAFGKIVEAVERAEKNRAPVQRLADKLAAYLVYFALAAALGTFAVTHNLRSTISVIIVAGACGVAAGTPLAILGAVGQAARRGVIVKGGLYMERLSSVDTVVLDKTGTLTYGNTEVKAIVPEPGVMEAGLLSVAASAERFSEHPLGRAIVRKAVAQDVPLLESEDFRYLPGKGIHCWVGRLPTLVGSRDFIDRLGIKVPVSENASCAEVFVAQGSRLLGKIQISDSMRRSAAPAVESLQQMNLRVLLMTGDSVPIAQAVAAELGVNEFAAGLLPERKLERIRQLQATGHKVAMVGDGINDAPALVESYVGVAMGSGTDIARESGGIILIGNDLAKFSEVVRIAKRCRRVILTNFVGTIAVDLVGIVLAMCGVLNPIAAVLVHVCSETAFILNSARLLPAFSRNSSAELLSAQAQ